MRNAQEASNELAHDHQTHQAIDHLQTGISQSEQRLTEQQCTVRQNIKLQALVDQVVQVVIEKQQLEAQVIENLYAELQKSIAEKTAYYEQH